MSAIEWVIVVLVVLCAFFSLLAGLGMLRLPDVYSRLHATGKSSVLGVVLAMMASFLYFTAERDVEVWKLLLVILFVLMTTPVAALIISRSGYRTGTPLHPSSVSDELKPYYESLEAAASKEKNREDQMTK